MTLVNTSRWEKVVKNRKKAAKMYEDGDSVREIAAALEVSVQTVKNYLTNEGVSVDDAPLDPNGVKAKKFKMDWIQVTDRLKGVLG